MSLPEPHTVMDASRLAAFTDGELTPEDAAAVVMHLADHPQDQAYVDDLMAANALLARAFAPPLEQPVPEAIMATITGEKPAGAKIFPFRRRSATWAYAGASLAAGITAFALLWPMRDASELAIGPIPSGSLLFDAVVTQPSGTTGVLSDEREFTILASMPASQGYCREIEVIDRRQSVLEMAIACGNGNAWTIAVALKEPLPEEVPSDGFVAAGGIETQSLTPWLDQLGAGKVLTPDEENALISREWRE